MATIPKLTRPQIARIVNGDEVAIRFFEALINQSLEASPDALALLREDVDDASSQASNAIGAVQSLSSEMGRIADALESMPAHASDEPEDVLLPIRVETKDHYYGSFSDTTTQTAAAINTPQAITFDTTDLSYGVYVGAPTSRIYANGHGVYNFQFSAQLDRTAGGASVVYFWVRINGVDVANTSGKIRIKDNNSELLAAWNYVLRMNPGDYFELMWETDDTSTVILAESSTATHPAVPSVILTVTDNID